MSRATRGYSWNVRGRSSDEEGGAKRHPTRERVIGENPVEVRKLAEELPEDAWENIFLRDSERKEIWCDMACLRIHQVRDGLPGPESWLIIRKDENGKKYQFSNASPDTKMNRLAEMSCSRYWIERALEDAKGEVGMADYERLARLAPSHDNGHAGDAIPLNVTTEMERQSPNADDTGCQRDSGLSLIHISEPTRPY